MFELMNLIHRYNGILLTRVGTSGLDRQQSTAKPAVATAQVNPDSGSSRLGPFMIPKDMPTRHLILLDLKIGR